MELPNISHLDSGFTLFESLIVIAIIAIIMSLGLVTTFDSYNAYLFHSEQAVLVSVLERARSKAMNNYYEAPYGVCYVEPNYIIFRGVTCSVGVVTNELTPSNAHVAIDNLTPSMPIIFDQLTGKLIPQLSPASSAISITLNQGSRASQITINNEGSINW